MTAEEFVINIKNMQPSNEMYRKLSVSSSFIVDYNRIFNLKTRETQQKFISPFEDLMYNYDVTNLTVGLIKFINPKYINEQYLAIAEVELDYLVLDQDLIKYISFTDNKVISCISTKDNFLKVLYELLNYLNNCLFALSNEDPCSVSEKLTQISSQPQSIGFYKMLCGCFD